MKNIKKITVLMMTTLVILSVLIFPTMSAIASNSVTWDSEYVWWNAYTVSGYVEITEYSGLVPTAYIKGRTNNGNYFEAKVTGVGSSWSETVKADIGGSLPFLSYQDTGIKYD